MKRRNYRKSNIIMTLALICAIIIIAALPLPVAQAASFTVSKSNVSIENGKTSTITINAATHTGRLDIVSSNTSVATVSEGSLWVENNSKTITISAKSAGTAKITIKGELYDAGTEEEATYTKTVNVTVTKVASSGGTNTGGTSSGDTSNGSTGGSQSGSTAGSTSNNNQSSNSGTSNSGGQSSSNTSKPSSGTTTSKPSSSSSQTSKPSSSSSSSSSQVAQNNTAVSTPPDFEQTAIEENNQEEIANQEENAIQEEQVNEEVPQEEAHENIITQELNSAQTNNVEGSNSVNSTGRIIMIAVIGAIAIAMIFIGIGVSKNIFKK